MSYEDLAEEARELRNEVNAFSTAFAGVVSQLGDQAHVSSLTITKLRKVIIWLVISLSLNVMLTVFVAVMGYRLQVFQSRTNDEVLCPLYVLFLNTYDKEQRDALPIDKQKIYDESFATINAGYTSLGCEEIIPAVPPVVPIPTTTR